MLAYGTVVGELVSVEEPPVEVDAANTKGSVTLQEKNQNKIGLDKTEQNKTKNHSAASRHWTFFCNRCI